MRRKAPNVVQLFFSMYKLIIEGEPSPNTTLTTKQYNYNETPKFKLNKNTQGAIKGEANQKQQLSDMHATKSFDIN